MEAVVGAIKSAVSRPRYSGLQKQVFQLYRDLLRATRDKPANEISNWRNFIKSRFKDNAKIAKKDVMRIEHELRKGKRDLELLRRPETQKLYFQTV